MALPTVAGFVHALRGDERVRLRFEDVSFTGDDYFHECARRAAYFRRVLDPAKPPHVGVLLENVPDNVFALGGAALAGATIVGANPTRRGAELARDIAHTDCQLLLTDAAGVAMFGDARPPLADDRVLLVDQPGWQQELGDDAPEVWDDVDPLTLFSLIFTSGTTSAPKAVRMSQVRLAGYGMKVCQLNELGPSDVMYGSMPLFHSNALITCWMPSVVSGATLVLKRKFSASTFVSDAHHYGVTYANYVGKTLSYVLAQPERDDDATIPLLCAFGNEAAPLDCDRFAERFQCTVRDGYGSTEGGVAIGKTPETPPGSLGVASYGTAVILDPDSGKECERARFDGGGRLVNAEQAIGEIVALDTASSFEGYYNDDASNAERVHDDHYWSGDLGYRDEAGFFYFAGRKGDWLRVDGENFAAAPIERILDRYAGLVLCAVYGVPDALAGDQVMAALLLDGGPSAFDPAAFATFLAAQADLGTKWAPRYLRLVHEFPQTETQKIVKRVLQREQWTVSDEVWWRPERGGGYREMTDEDRDLLRAEFARHGREHYLTALDIS